MNPLTGQRIRLTIRLCILAIAIAGCGGGASEGGGAYTFGEIRRCFAALERPALVVEPLERGDYGLDTSIAPARALTLTGGVGSPDDDPAHVVLLVLIVGNDAEAVRDTVARVREAGRRLSLSQPAFYGNVAALALGDMSSFERETVEQCVRGT